MDDSTRADLGHAHGIYACHSRSQIDTYDKILAVAGITQQLHSIAAGNSPNQTTDLIGCDSSPVAAAALGSNGCSSGNVLGILALLKSPPTSAAAAAAASDVVEAVLAGGRVRGESSAAATVLGLGITPVHLLQA